MRHGLAIATAAAVLLSACATNTGSPQAMAEQQCSALVRQEGLRLLQVNGMDAQADKGQVVKMRVEDALGRRFDATCAVASDGAARWAQPLPSNVSRAKS
jgi:hypothetical protein